MMIPQDLRALDPVSCRHIAQCQGGSRVHRGRAVFSAGAVIVVPDLTVEPERYFRYNNDSK